MTPIRNIERDIFRLVRDRREMTFNDIANRMDIPRRAVRGAVQKLQRCNWLETETLGPKATIYRVPQ